MIRQARLNKAVRAHGNAAEYIPIFVALVSLPAAIGRERMDQVGGHHHHRMPCVAGDGHVDDQDLQRATASATSHRLARPYVGGFILGTALILRALL